MLEQGGGGLGGADTGEEKSDEVGGDLEGDDPPGVVNVDFCFLCFVGIADDALDVGIGDFQFHSV